MRVVQQGQVVGAACPHNTSPSNKLASSHAFTGLGVVSGDGGKGWGAGVVCGTSAGGSVGGTMGSWAGLGSLAVVVSMIMNKVKAEGWWAQFLARHLFIAAGHGFDRLSDSSNLNGRRFASC